MSGKPQAATRSWGVRYRESGEPFNDPDKPTVVTVHLRTGMIVDQGKLVAHPFVGAPDQIKLTLRLKLPRLQKSSTYLKAFRERRYPVTCDEVPNIVCLIGGERGWWEVEYTLD